MIGVCVALAAMSLVMMTRLDGAGPVLPQSQPGVVTADGGRVLAGGAEADDGNRSSPRAEALDEIARAYMEVGDVSRAIGSAESIRDPNRRDIVLAYIADRLIPRTDGSEDAHGSAGWKGFEPIVAGLAAVEKIGNGLVRVELLAKIAKASRPGGPPETSPEAILARAGDLASTLSPDAIKPSRVHADENAWCVAWGLLGTVSLGTLGLLVSAVLTPLAQELTKDLAVPIVKARLGRDHSDEGDSDPGFTEKRIAS
jgi:hypothetical protein